ncbi:MAG: hypothetical protein HY869_08535 [Chloroflexi bacterium]|nr:hypothetical protein [Chloroflexota bacterium]
MLDALGRILAWWGGREPSASLMMYVAAVLLFAGVFVAANNRFTGYAAGLERFAHALGYALLYIGVLGASYFLLDKSLGLFRPVASRLALGEDHNERMMETRKRWGGEIQQAELGMALTRSYEEVMEIPDAYPSPQYINRIVTEPVEEGGIVEFNGAVDIEVIDPSLTTYMASVEYQYLVENQSEYTTTATFKFPIIRNRYYENLSVSINGEDWKYNFQADNLAWKNIMLPRQVDMVKISFSVRGMENFSYYVPEQRGIEAFLLTIHLNTRNYYTLTKPGEDAIELKSVAQGSGQRSTWVIKRAIMKPIMGIRLNSTEQPDLRQWDAISFANYGPAAVMLVGVTTLLTMLIMGLPVRLDRFLLYLGVFSAQFLGFMGLDLLQIHYVVPIILFSLLALGLTFLIYKDVPRLSRNLILALTLIFSVGYPLGNLLPDEQARSIFGMIVQSLILLYIFGLTLFVRVQQNSKSRSAE